jgi:hypothetical protein
MKMLSLVARKCLIVGEHGKHSVMLGTQFVSAHLIDARSGFHDANLFSPPRAAQSFGRSNTLPLLVPFACALVDAGPPTRVTRRLTICRQPGTCPASIR